MAENPPKDRRNAGRNNKCYGESVFVVLHAVDEVHAE